MPHAHATHQSTQVGTEERRTPSKEGRTVVGSAKGKEEAIKAQVKGAHAT
jgi:hypothetical protein